MRRRDPNTNSFKYLDMKNVILIDGDDKIEYYRNQNNVFFYCRKLADGEVKIGVCEYKEVLEFVNHHCPEKQSRIFAPVGGGTQAVRLTLTEQQRAILNYLQVFYQRSKKELLEENIDLWLQSEMRNIKQEQYIDLRLDK